MVATKIYKKTEPTLDAPAPSYFLSFVNDKINPPVVAMTINQKNLDVKLNYAS